LGFEPKQEQGSGDMGGPLVWNVSRLFVKVCNLWPAREFAVEGQGIKFSTFTDPKGI
jgi:hypothetical protein